MADLDNASPESASAATTGVTSSGTASDSLIKMATASLAEPSADAASQVTGAEPASPIVTPATTEQPAVSPKTPGPIPFDRHESILKNAREEAVKQFAWAQGLDPASVREALSLMKELTSDPRSFAKNLAGLLEPEKPAEPEEEFTLPEPDLVSQDGKLKTYSNDAIVKMLDAYGRKIRKEILGEVKPALDFTESEKANRVKADRMSQAKSSAARVLTEARKLPHFTKENEPKIQERVRTMDPQLRRELGPVGAIYHAYNTFVAEEISPSQQQTAEAKVREGFEKKAATSRGSAHPTDAGSEAGKPQIRSGDVDGLAKYMERLEAGA